jgi:hypothetical protein
MPEPTNQQADVRRNTLYPTTAAGARHTRIREEEATINAPSLVGITGAPPARSARAPVAARRRSVERLEGSIVAALNAGWEVVALART